MRRTLAGEHRIIRLATPLEYVILDTEDLSLCRQPATLAYAWLVQDERNGPLWSLRPVCGVCEGGKRLNRLGPRQWCCLM